MGAMVLVPDSLPTKTPQNWPMRVNLSLKPPRENPMVAVASLVSLFTNDFVITQHGGLFSAVGLFQKESNRLQERFGQCVADAEKQTNERKKQRNQTIARNSHVQLSHRAVNTGKHLLSGAVAAMISRTAVAPLERLKLEYMVRETKTGLVVTLQRILRTEGLSGFWQGNAINLIRTAPFKSLNYFAFDTYRKFFLKLNGKSEISNMERLASGAAAGVTATVLCYPLDTLRTRMVATGGVACSGMITCCSNLIRTEGFGALYRGLLPAVTSMAPGGAVFYGTYDFLRSSYLKSPKGQALLVQRHDGGESDTKKASTGGSQNGRLQMELGPTRTLLYGAIAGAAAEVATYPFEVVRRHLQLQGGARLGVAATVSAIVQKNGPGALYAGIVPSILQVLPSAALSYFVYEFLKAEMKTH